MRALVTHLWRENRAAILEQSRAHIGPLCREIQRDVLEEESDWIKEKLFEEFSKEIAKGVVHGFALFYQKLLSNGPTVWQDTQINKNEN